MHHLEDRENGSLSFNLYVGIIVSELTRFLSSTLGKQIVRASFAFVDSMAFSLLLRGPTCSSGSSRIGFRLICSADRERPGALESSELDERETKGG